MDGAVHPVSAYTKVRVYQTLVLPISTYAYKTQTLSRRRQKRLEAFHMKCQRQIAEIRWQDHVRNTDVSSLTDFGPVLDPIVRRRSSLFGHVARFPEDTLAHQSFRCHRATQICHSVAFQTQVGGTVRAILGTGGLTCNSAGTMVHVLLTSGDEPSHVDTRG